MHLISPAASQSTLHQDVAALEVLAQTFDSDSAMRSIHGRVSATMSSLKRAAGGWSAIGISPSVWWSLLAPDDSVQNEIAQTANVAICTFAVTATELLDAAGPAIDDDAEFGLAVGDGLQVGFNPRLVGDGLDAAHEVAAALQVVLDGLERLGTLVDRLQ